MEKRPKTEYPFKKPCCCECGAELERALSVYEVYEKTHRLYCDSCKPVAEIKENWKPLGSGAVSRVFFVKDRKDPPSN